MRVGHQAGRRIPFLGHCRIQDSVRLGGRGTSVEGDVCVRGLYFVVWEGRYGTYCEPDGDVGISRIAGAACILFVAEGFDYNWVVEGSWFRSHDVLALNIRGGASCSGSYEI